MSSEKKDLHPDLVVSNKAGQGLSYQGRTSCQSCRYVNYNGETCGQVVSPLYGKRVGPTDWCRLWSPQVGHNIPLTK